MYKGILMSFFERDFLSVILDIEEEYRTEILKNSPYLFRKWYHSKLRENMDCSPFALISQKYRSPKDEIFIPSFHINREHKNKPLFDIDFKFISNENHIILEDLKTVVSEFKNGVFMNNSDNPFFDLKSDLLSKVSKEEDLYINYLILLGVSLELIISEETVFGDLLKPREDYLSFFEKETALNEVFDCAISIAALNIFDTESPEIKNMLITFLKKEHDPNSLIKSIAFNKNKEVFNYFDGLENGNISEKNTRNLLEIYKYSILADKWFFTPFGNYFYFIELFNQKKYDVSNDVNEMYNRIILNKSLCPSIHCLYSSFALTKLGQSILKTHKKCLSLSDLVSPEKLNEVIADILDDRAKEREFKNIKYDDNEVIYVLKVYEEKNKDFYSVVQVSEKNTLYECILFLNMLFKNETFVPKICNVKNTNYINLNAKIGDLIEEEKLIISFRNEFSKKEEFTGIILKVSEKKKNLIYPRILSVNKPEKEKAV